MEDNLLNEIEKIKILSNMLIKNSHEYYVAKGDSKYGPYAGSSFPKNSNISRTALKNQIVTLRNELLLLSSAL